MKSYELKAAIKKRWPDYGYRIYQADVNYTDGIDDDNVLKARKRWKYGFFGLFAPAPIRSNEKDEQDDDWDCDDNVRDFICWFRKKYRVKRFARPIFFTGYDHHGYVSFLSTDGTIKSLDLRYGTLVDIEPFVIEML